jgi:hypothetical protein
MAQTYVHMGSPKRPLRFPISTLVQDTAAHSGNRIEKVAGAYCTVRI